MSKKSSFVEGLIDSPPFLVAMTFLALSFGAIGHQSGVDVWQLLFMSLFIYAMPLQIVLLHLLHVSTTLVGVAITAVLVNFRLSLMTASMLPYFKQIKGIWIFFATFCLGASAFTICHVKFDTAKRQENFSGFHYYLGVAGIGYVFCLIFTLVGFYVTSLAKSSLLASVLMMILPIHFAALTAMRWPRLRPVLATLAGFILMPLVKEMGTAYTLIITPLIVGVVFVFFHKEEAEL